MYPDAIFYDMKKNELNTKQQKLAFSREKHMPVRLMSVLVCLALAMPVFGDCVKGDCKNGKGVYEYTSGARYEGEFVNGELHGYGIFFYTNGNRYEGYWEGNYKHGTGTMQYASGELYEGSWYRDRRQGHGTYTFKNGDRYMGEWHWDRPNGEGELRFVNGAHYIGGFKDGKFHGQGAFRDESGKVYSGVWTEGKLPGFNTPVEPEPADEVVDLEAETGDPGAEETAEPAGETGAEEGDVAGEPGMPGDGEDAGAGAGGQAGDGALRKPVEPNWELVRDCFMEKCMEGLGYITYASGSRYFGSFVNGVPEGEGTCFYANGDVYTGGWSNHRPEGEGTMFYADGRIVSALWKNGRTSKIIERQVETVEQPQSGREPDPVSRVYAVVIGVADYTYLPALKYTDDDAWRTYAFLKSPEGGALGDEQLVILVDEHATRNKIRKAVRDMAAKADANDRLMIFLHGHGARAEFAPVDFDGFGNSLALTELADWLEQSQAGQKAVFAEIGYEGGPEGRVSEGGDLQRLLSDAGTGMAFLLSGQTAGTTIEDPELRQGIFNYYLLRGMAGTADEDRDGIVSFSELAHYVSHNVSAFTGNAQEPMSSGNYDPGMPVAQTRY